jgi:Uma2 family endonuclease
MNVLVQPRPITPDDLMRMPDRKSFELVNGELLELRMGVFSGVVQTTIGGLIFAHCQSTKAGWVIVGSDTGYRCFPNNPLTVRKPDVSFVRAERWEPGFLHEGFLTIVPDLAVEVVSLNDLAREVVQKIEEYLAAGFPLIWVVYPECRLVDIYRKDGSVTRLRADAEITGEDVLPGFRCLVASFFPPQEKASV